MQQVLEISTQTAGNMMINTDSNKWMQNKEGTGGPDCCTLVKEELSG